MRTFLLVATLVGAIIVTGCNTENGNTQTSPPTPAPSQNEAVDMDTPRDESNLTLEQVNTKTQFQLLLPTVLPHDMKFQTASASVNSKDGKTQDLAMIYNSPDQKYSLTVREFEGTSVEMPNHTVLKEQLYGQNVLYYQDDHVVSIVFCNGKVVCSLSTPTGTDIADELALLEIARQFK